MRPRTPRGRPLLALCLAAGLFGHASIASALTLTVDPSKPGKRVPAGLTGLSFEAESLRAPWLTSATGSTAQLIRQLDPVSLRFSANAVERQFWTQDPAEPIPAWATGVLTPTDLQRGGAFARDVGSVVDLGLNFGHFDAPRAADQARAAAAALGPTLRSFQIGNEPDLYVLFGDRDRTYYTYDTYRKDELIYRAAINAAAPGVPIAGPDTSGFGRTDQALFKTYTRDRVVNGWLRPYARDYRGSGPYLNTHLYPLTSCFGVPRRGELLSKSLQRDTSRFFKTVRGIAEKADMALHLSETNSSSCGGKGAEFSSFASALWIVNYVLLGARAGVAEMNFHTTGDCRGYSVICFPDQAARTAGNARAEPAYYGLMLAKQVLGGRFLPMTRSDGRGHVVAHALRGTDGATRVVLVNMTERPAGTVRIRVPTSATQAAVQRLTAPSMRATTNVRFGGAAVQPDGRLTPGPGTPTRVTRGRLAVNLPGASAALITIPAQEAR